MLHTRLGSNLRSVAKMKAFTGVTDPTEHRYEYCDKDDYNCQYGNTIVTGLRFTDVPEAMTEQQEKVIQSILTMLDSNYFMSALQVVENFFLTFGIDIQDWETFIIEQTKMVDPKALEESLHEMFPKPVVQDTDQYLLSNDNDLRRELANLVHGDNGRYFFTSWNLNIMLRLYVNPSIYVGPSFLENALIYLDPLLTYKNTKREMLYYDTYDGSKRRRHDEYKTNGFFDNMYAYFEGYKFLSNSLDIKMITFNTQTNVATYYLANETTRVKQEATLDGWWHNDKYYQTLPSIAEPHIRKTLYRQYLPSIKDEKMDNVTEAEEDIHNVTEAEEDIHDLTEAEEDIHDLTLETLPRTNRTITSTNQKVCEHPYVCYDSTEFSQERLPTFVALKGECLIPVYPLPDIKDSILLSNDSFYNITSLETVQNTSERYVPKNSLFIALLISIVICIFKKIHLFKKTGQTSARGERAIIANIDPPSTVTTKNGDDDTSNPIPVVNPNPDDNTNPAVNSIPDDSPNPDVNPNPAVYPTPYRIRRPNVLSLHVNTSTRADDGTRKSRYPQEGNPFIRNKNKRFGKQIEGLRRKNQMLDLYRRNQLIDELYPFHKRFVQRSPMDKRQKIELDAKIKRGTQRPIIAGRKTRKRKAVNKTRRRNRRYS
jgi:hypothetical protein